jgi:hypothetical protein
MNSYMSAAEAERLTIESERDSAWSIIFWIVLLGPIGALYQTFRQGKCGRTGVAMACLAVGVAWLILASISVSALSAKQAESAYTPATLAQSMTDTYAEDGERYENVRCVKRDGNVYRCQGDYAPNRDAVRNTAPGLSEQDIDGLVQVRSGVITMDVTVESDGGWKSEPIS